MWNSFSTISWERHLNFLSFLSFLQPLLCLHLLLLFKYTLYLYIYTHLYRELCFFSVQTTTNSWIVRTAVVTHFSNLWYRARVTSYFFSSRVMAALTLVVMVSKFTSIFLTTDRKSFTLRKKQTNKDLGEEHFHWWRNQYIAIYRIIAPVSYRITRLLPIHTTNTHWGGKKSTLTSDWLLSGPEWEWNRRRPSLSPSQTDSPPTGWSGVGKKKVLP